MLRHPKEKRKKAATRVKSSTWCERIWAPILESKNVRVLHWKENEDNVQALKDTEGTKAERRTKYREIAVEESCRPPHFRNY